MRLSKSFKNTHGQAIVEMAFALIFYAAFLFAIADLAKITYTWTSLQHVVNDSGRWGSVQTTTNNRTQMIKDRIISAAAALRVTVQANDITVGSGINQSLGYFNLKATANVNVSPLTGLLLTMFGNHSGVYRVTSESIIRNETL